MRTYGHIRLTDDTPRRWEISRLEPHVAIRLKHLFPRVPKHSAGPFYLAHDNIHSADIDWFLMRYPLEISKKDREVLTTGRNSFNAQQAEMERILLPDYEAPAIVGLREGQAIRQYQIQAIEILRRRGMLLLGDEGGLGKTYTAAGFLCSEPGALPAAVVCDTHMQMQWQEKIEDFTTLRVHVIKKSTPYDLPLADVYIFRISQIAGWIDFFETGFFKAAIYDEPQSLRTGTTTGKGAAARVLSLHSNFRLGLSATPVLGYGKEIWNVMQFIDDQVLGSQSDFEREWTDEQGRIKDPKALGSLLREQHAMIRRLKGDVGLQLPRVSRIVEHVDYDAKTVKSIEELAQQLAIRATTGSYVERGQAARDLDIMVRQATGVAKAHSVAQYVRLMVEIGQPVLLAGWHRAVYDIWLEQLADLKPAMYTGSESSTKKEQEKNRFLNGDTDVMIMSLRSGAGLDGLQHRCSVLVIGELDWTPGIHDQLAWRLDREGQTDPVTVFFLVTDAGSDPLILDVLGIKKNEATQIIDPYLGVHAREEDMSNVRRLVEHYLKRSSNNTRNLQTPNSEAA